MAELALLKYPKKSHRKAVTLSRHSAQLAEFIGIMMGDGGINNPWQAVITVNATADIAYAEYVCRLSESLFGLRPVVRKRRAANALSIVLSSTTLVDFLVEQGLVRGNKLAQRLEIPRWILARPSYRRACIRGLVDTDGCLYIHSHTVRGKSYANIGLCFTSASPELIRQVAVIFEEFGIMPHISTGGRDIYLYRASAVGRYLDVFGTSNERIAGVYKKWRDG